MNALPRNQWVPCPICSSEYDGVLCHACKNNPAAPPSVSVETSATKLGRLVCCAAHVHTTSCYEAAPLSVEVRPTSNTEFAETGRLFKSLSGEGEEPKAPNCPECQSPLRQVGSKAPNTCWACDTCAVAAQGQKDATGYAPEGEELLDQYDEEHHDYLDGRPHQWQAWRGRLLDRLRVGGSPARSAEGQLREALQRLYDETADYIRINNLGDVHHNQAMQMARDALNLDYIEQRNQESGQLPQETPEGW